MNGSLPDPGALKKQRMGHSEKDRLATTVVDLWCSFQYELAGDKRKYPMREFFSFASAARRYINLTRHDQLVRRDVAVTMNGLRELLQQERKRVPGTVLFEADRLECLFFAGYDPHFEGTKRAGFPSSAGHLQWIVNSFIK